MINFEQLLEYLDEPQSQMQTAHGANQAADEEREPQCHQNPSLAQLCVSDRAWGLPWIYWMRLMVRSTCAVIQ